MGIPIESMGNRVSLVSQPDLPQGTSRHLARRAQIHAAQEKTAAIERFESSLPGSGKDHTPEIQQAAMDFEKISLAFNKKLQFVVDHQSHEITVKVIDPVTDKVIKVLPPEELQRLHFKIKETIGFLFDEKV